jgi:hypothetical protein
MTRQERASIWLAEIWKLLDGEQTWEQAIKTAEKRIRASRGAAR